MTNRILIILSAILISAQAQSQSLDSVQLWDGERKVAALIEKCFNQTDDAHRTAYATEAANELEYLLNTPLAFGYDFPYLKALSSVSSDNGKVRVITFGVPMDGGKYIYHGFVMHNDDDDITVTRLRQGKRPESDPMNANMQSGNWYGAIYYEISQIDRNGIYILCGWDGYNMLANRKVLEQMNFDEENKPIFGGLFQTEKGNGFSRIIFTFNEQAVMTLKYNKKKKMIIADHLQAPPEYPEYQANENLYGPDLSYDGYFYKDGRWHMEPDVDIKMQRATPPIGKKNSNKSSTMLLQQKK